MPALYRPVTPAGFATPANHGVTLSRARVPGFDAATRLRQEVEASRSERHRVQVDADDRRCRRKALYLASVATVIYGGMGVFGLILASVGLAGVTAQAVARRTHEIGIRMALGARRGRRVVAGAAGEQRDHRGGHHRWTRRRASGITWALASFVEDAGGDDADEHLGSAAADRRPRAAGGLALVACYLPARRSTRIDPVTALRAE